LLAPLQPRLLKTETGMIEAVLRRDPADGQDSALDSTCTGIDGTYQLQALPQDTYKVRAQANGYADFCAYAGGPDFLNGQPIFVTGGDAIQFNPAMWVGADSVQGHVTDEDGQPALGTFSVERADDQSWSAAAYADDSGYYRMTSIPTRECAGPAAGGEPIAALALDEHVHGPWLEGGS
jgi:hypothetical protein